MGFHHDQRYHNEEHIPDWCFFYCDVPPQKGGQTPILLSSAIYEEMVEKDPDFVIKLEKVPYPPGNYDANKGLQSQLSVSIQ